ncbi:MAG: ECF-type sigma factor [Pirellulaceae bacterium]
MADDQIQFKVFLAAIRSGDAQAAQRLVTQYESLLRREIRFRMRDPRLRRVLDSGDVCQSVLASFFVRATAGQFELNEEHDLLRLLMSMAKRKTAAAARRAYSQKRDVRLSLPIGEYDQPLRNSHSPSKQVAYAELASLLDQELSAEERKIVALRNDSCTWQQIADHMGGTADKRRIQLSRAVERVCRKLGLDEGN